MSNPTTAEGGLVMGFSKKRARLVAAGVSVCTFVVLAGLGSAGCGKQAGGRPATASHWTYSTKTDARGRVTQRQAEVLASDQLPDLGARLALWADDTGKHVSLSSATGSTRPLACSYEHQFVLARLDGGPIEKVACEDGPALTLYPKLYDRVRSAKVVCLEADTPGGSTHSFRFQVAGLDLPLR